MPSFTTTVAANTFTENSATVDRDRVVTGSVELTAVTEQAAVIGGNRLVACATEAMAFTETSAAVLIFRATIAQTFSGMTQTATAEANYSTLHETALAQGFPIETPEELLEDTALAGDQMFVILHEALAETAIATEELIPDTFTVLHETATATEQLNVEWLTLLDDSKGKVTEQITQVVTAVLADAATATDTLFPSITTVLHETAYASESLEASATVNETLVGSATANGDPTPYYFVELTGTATATEVLTDVLTQNDILVGTLTATDTQVATVVARETLSDTALASDAQDFSGSIANETLHETATADGMPWAKDFAALAWVMNTETQGLSSYDNFQFTSLAQLNGVVYGTSSEGIFVLSGDDDDGRNVDSTVKTGFLDFDREQTKRVSDLYVGYTGGQLECTVETYDGPQEEYTYTLEEREADAPRNNRMKVGRGLSSRYWRFKFENVQGADFQIYDTAAQVAQSKRRL